MQEVVKTFFYVTFVVGFCLFTLIVRSMRPTILRDNDQSHPVSESDPTSFKQKVLKTSNDTRKPNILFLIADDMRPEVGVYSGDNGLPWLNPSIRTPALDRLAGESLLFRNAYCQQSWCNPSRSSFLTSRRPDTTMVHNNSVSFRANMPYVITLPQYFKEHGYMTLGVGKVFHLLNTLGDHDDEYSWSEPMLRCNHEDYLPEPTDWTWWAVRDEDRHGMPLLDEFVTNQAIEKLQRIGPAAKSGAQPFFLAVGLKKPHLPFVFPGRYLQHYPLEKLEGPANPNAPINMPHMAWVSSNEVPKKNPQKWQVNSTFPLHFIKKLRRAYYSSISYIDDLIGRILDELEDLGLTQDTIVTFIGDHGYHLGEHGIFGKNTNFEVANHSPMMIKVPGVTDDGMMTTKLVEFVDIFPTLVELTGHERIPVCPRHNYHNAEKIRLCTEGNSLVPLFRDPSSKSWKEIAFFQYPRYISPTRYCMGYSLRTYRYRYTEWVRYDYHSQKVGPDWSDVCDIELYDHRTDPRETHNIAHDKKAFDIIQEFKVKIRRGWYGVVTRATESLGH